MTLRCLLNPWRFSDNLLVEHVTHWMPLPNPPKE
ncbi:DUF551 domain-containing protein [Enterobacter hormaechei]